MYINRPNNVAVLLPVIGTLVCFLFDYAISGPIPLRNNNHRRRFVRSVDAEEDDDGGMLPYGAGAGGLSAQSDPLTVANIVDTGVEFLIKNDADEPVSNQAAGDPFINEVIFPSPPPASDLSQTEELDALFRNSADSEDDNQLNLAAIARSKRIPMADVSPDGDTQALLDQLIMDAMERPSTNRMMPDYISTARQSIPVGFTQDETGSNQGSDTGRSQEEEAGLLASAAALDILAQRPKLVRQDALDLTDEEANQLLKDVITNGDDDDTDDPGDDDDEEEGELEKIKQAIDHLIEEKHQKKKMRLYSQSGTRKRTRRSVMAVPVFDGESSDQDEDDDEQNKISPVFIMDDDENGDQAMENMAAPPQSYADPQADIELDAANRPDVAIALGSVSDSDMDGLRLEPSTELDDSSVVQGYRSRGKRSDDRIPYSDVAEDDLAGSLPWDVPLEPEMSSESMPNLLSDMGYLPVERVPDMLGDSPPDMQFDNDAAGESDQVFTPPIGDDDMLELINSQTQIAQPQFDFTDDDSERTDIYPTFEPIQVVKRNSGYIGDRNEDVVSANDRDLYGNAGGNQESDRDLEKIEALFDAADMVPNHAIPMPDPESEDLPEEVAGRYRVCDMVRNKFYKQMDFTGRTLEVDECYVTCERRDGNKVFSHIFKLVDWPCGNRLEGTCDKWGSCSAFERRS